MKKGKNTVLNYVCQNFVIVIYNHPTSIVNDIETKAKTLDIVAYYRNESKMFGLLKIGTEAERFGLVRIFYIKSSSLPFRPIGSGTKRTNLIWSRNCLRRSGTFLCNKNTYRSKQNILIW